MQETACRGGRVEMSAARQQGHGAGLRGDVQPSPDALAHLPEEQVRLWPNAH